MSSVPSVTSTMGVARSVAPKRRSSANLPACRSSTRLLLSGLICGILWEFWNFWAGAKWVYSIPYLNGFRVFEMPLAGFLGFPPFALICYLMYRLSLAPRVWITARRSRVILMAALYLLCCGTMFLGIERLTVLEYKPFWPW